MRFTLFKITIILLGIILLVCTSEAIAEEPATIVYLKGEVRLRRSGEDYWILAKEGMAIFDNDKISTSKDSEAEIALDKSLKNIVRLEPDTEISLKDLRAKRIYMPKGRLLSLIESLSPGSSFEVRTPTAVAGVAGSGIGVSTDGKKTHIGCFEDKAYAKGINPDGSPMDKTIIEEGYKRIVEQFQPPTDPLPLTEFEKRDWLRFKEGLTEHLGKLRKEKDEGQKDAGQIFEQIEEMQEQTEYIEDNKENIYESQEFDKRDKLLEPPASNAGQGDGER